MLTKGKITMGIKFYYTVITGWILKARTLSEENAHSSVLLFPCSSILPIMLFISYFIVQVSQL